MDLQTTVSSPCLRPTPSLYEPRYWPVPGRVEFIRLLFSLADPFHLHLPGTHPSPFTPILPVILLHVFSSAVRQLLHSQAGSKAVVFSSQSSCRECLHLYSCTLFFEHLSVLFQGCRSKSSAFRSRKEYFSFSSGHQINFRVVG